MRFKARKKRKYRIIIFYFIIGLISYHITYNYLSVTKDLVIDNEELLINFGLNNYFPKINKVSVKNILYEGLNYSIDNIPASKTYNKSPTVYIYNTHQTESYDTNLFNTYNISYTVETASYLLKDSLNVYNIESVVEKENIASYLNMNNLSYKDSYKASRYFMEQAIKKYPSIEYLIDIHRDSQPKNKTTSIINGKPYAKVLFVIGKNNPNYLENYALASKINSKLNKDLTNGIIEKSGTNVNGVYNQDLNGKVLLIEIGGLDNTIEEVNNTCILLAKAIYESIGESNE